MNLVVVSHKPCWTDPNSTSGYGTDGGFAFQMEALSELFDRTTVLMPANKTPAPCGTNPLMGTYLSVTTLSRRAGRYWPRRLSLLVWLTRNLGRIWSAVAQADAVHVPMGSAVGTLAILVALAQRKHLFVRYCGRWGHPQTWAQRFWHWLLVQIAGGRNVVLATGGGNQPPSPRNPHIQWVFATTLRKAELDALRPRQPWRPGEPLRLITVGRQEPGKNTDRVIQALALVRRHYPQATLEVVGDGSCLSALRRLAADLDLADAVGFPGKLDHQGVIAALCRAHLFCLPTDSEGFPKAVHEALACGLPVITTPVSVLPYLVANDNGILLSDTAPQTIAGAVLELASNESRFRAMVRSAQSTAQHYSLENWRDAIGRHLEKAWGPCAEASGNRSREDVPLAGTEPAGEM